MHTVALMRDVFAKLWHSPMAFRLGLIYADAVKDVRDRRFTEAEAKLVHIREKFPQHLGNHAPATLLLAFVYLQTGNAILAADTAFDGVEQAQRLRFLRPPELAYLSYAGKLIYERATWMAGKPKVLSLAFGLADLKLEAVRSAIEDPLPLTELVTTGKPIH